MNRHRTATTTSSTRTMELVTPQRPLVSPSGSSMLLHGQLYSHTNSVTTAIMCLGGHNQEDSQVFNRDAVDRGRFHSYTRTSYRIDLHEFALPRVPTPTECARLIRQGKHPESLGPWTCDTCQTAFLTLHGYQRHVSLSRFRCPLPDCYVTTSSLAQLVQHANDEHPLTLPARCVECGRPYTTTELAEAHADHGCPLRMCLGTGCCTYCGLAHSDDQLCDEREWPFLQSVVQEGTLVWPGDILVFARDSNVSSLSTNRRGHRLLSLPPHTRGIVESVECVPANLVAQTPASIIVVVGTLCIPRVGDKFVSRFGQKGVISRLERSTCLPFVNSGVCDLATNTAWAPTAEVVINPNAIPSRMTIGQLLESLLAAVVACKGDVDWASGASTPFESWSAERILSEARKVGLTERPAYNGLSGDVLEEPVNWSITAYQRLHHLVEEKMHALGASPLAPVDLLTRQPIRGRKNQGGLRVGPMELDSLMCRDAKHTVEENVMDKSDGFAMRLCRKCQSTFPDMPDDVIVPRGTKDWRRCPYDSCQGQATVRVRLPYTTNLCVQAQRGMGLMPHFEV